MLRVVNQQHILSPLEPWTPAPLATAASPPCPFKLPKAHE